MLKLLKILGLAFFGLLTLGSGLCTILALASANVWNQWSTLLFVLCIGLPCLLVGFFASRAILRSFDEPVVDADLPQVPVPLYPPLTDAERRTPPAP